MKAMIMEFHLLNRLREIRTTLGPLLKEFEIKPVLQSGVGGLRIRLENKDGSRFSPVTIFLGEAAIGGNPTSGWRGSWVEIDGWDKFAVGHNGWTYNVRTGNTSPYDLGDDDATAIGTLRDMVSTCGVMLVGGGREKHTDDAEFANAFQHLDDALAYEGVMEITCERTAGIESFNFVHTSGKAWRVAFEDTKAVLYVDEKEISSCASNDAKGPSRLVREELHEERQRVGLKR